MGKNIGFISTRFAGTDGVTLEASKWAEVFENNGHRCFWFAGKLDRDRETSFLIPEAHFQHEQNISINKQILGQKRRTPSVTNKIHRLRSLLKKQLHDFINRYNIDLLIAENALSIPMHVPLGLALTETIAETHIPTIAHHHDFFWERVRFSINAASDYLRMAFPPSLPNIQHVVINTEAREQLALRTGIASTIIPNVLDFENPPTNDINGTRRFRKTLGLKPDDRIILQPTRIVKRKGIEHAIELVMELKDPRNKLVVSHEAGDEGFEYLEWLKEYAREHNVDLRLVNVQISDPWLKNGERKTAITLWDVYPFADFITYPSLYEGFGNAFLEAIYFKKPVLINRYANFVRDIEPLGFDLTVMDGYLTKGTVRNVKEVLESPRRRKKMVNKNYEIAARQYSYRILRSQLTAILSFFFGDAVEHLTSKIPEQTPAGYLDFDPDQVVFTHYDANCR